MNARILNTIGRWLASCLLLFTIVSCIDDGFTASTPGVIDEDGMVSLAITAQVPGLKVTRGVDVNHLRHVAQGVDDYPRVVTVRHIVRHHPSAGQGIDNQRPVADALRSRQVNRRINPFRCSKYVFHILEIKNIIILIIQKQSQPDETQNKNSSRSPSSSFPRCGLSYAKITKPADKRK